jgi:hypothetical protein
MLIVNSLEMERAAVRAGINWARFDDLRFNDSSSIEPSSIQPSSIESSFYNINHHVMGL